jgi:hypothetical protein
MTLVDWILVAVAVTACCLTVAVIWMYLSGSGIFREAWERHERGEDAAE